MKRFIENFEKKLNGISFETIEESKHSVFALSENLEIIYFNQAWLDFSKNNDGEPDITNNFPIGTKIENAISGDLKKFYKQNYAKVFIDKQVWSHDYECSSPNHYRLFNQKVFPLKDNKGLIVVNSLKIENPINYKNPTNHNIEQYIQETGFINQCSNCRRTQRSKDSKTWDWIPKWVTKLPQNTSHTICPICFDYYWK